MKKVIFCFAVTKFILNFALQFGERMISTLLNNFWWWHLRVSIREW